MIPIVKYQALGLPYHGEIVGTQLTLPNSSTMTTTAMLDGAVYEVQNPSAPGNVDTPPAGGSWRTYGLITSAQRYIGGRPLGANRWLYCDGNGRTWVLYATYTIANSTSFKISVILESAFGRFSTVNRYTDINRTLVELTLSATSIDIADTAYISSTVTQELGIEHNYSGSEAVFNIYTQTLGQVGSTYENFLYKSTTTALLAYVSIDITGNGSVNPDYLGNGISGSITFGENRSTFNTNSSITHTDGTYLVSGQIQNTSFDAASTEYGAVIGTDCYSYIKEYSCNLHYDYDVTNDKSTVGTYDTMMRRAFSGNTAGWVKFRAQTTTGSIQVVTVSGSYQTWTNTEYSWDGSTCTPGTVTNGTIETARSGSCKTDTHNDVSITIYGVTGSITSSYTQSTGTQDYYVNSYTPSGVICLTNTNDAGNWVSQTPSDSSSGEAMTVELLNARVANIKTASTAIKCISVEGGTYTNSTFENVSYQPHTGEWNTDATYVTSWA